ncbi:MAG: polymer-forming cytoskeletal protein [Rhodospirillales bacterium]
MFSKTSKGSKSSSPAPEPKPSSNNPPSLISADLKITGDLVSDGEIHVDGTIEGDIRTRDLLIGETANIKGGVNADKVHVHGYITGQIKAREVNLAKTAHVVGDILHEDLSIEAGAFLEGHCKRIAEKKEDSAGSKINLVAKDRGGDEPSAQSSADANPKGGSHKNVAAGTA